MTEIPYIWSHFKFTILLSLLMLVMMVILGVAPWIPYSWEITTFLAWWPMTSIWGSHLLLPIVLNPSLMTFSF